MPLTRMCVGCRRRDSTTQLVRVVRRDNGVAVDTARTAPGRGAYVHRTRECLTAARRVLPRALRAPGGLDTAPLQELAD